MAITQASTARRQAIQPLADSFASIPCVVAVALGGSAARGQADRYSDIELAVFWREPPQEEVRRSAITRSSADLHILFPFDEGEQVWCEDCFIGRNAANEPKSGILVEVIHYLDSHVERVIEDVLVRHETEDLKQLFLSGILDCVGLYGELQIAAWKARAGDYPRELSLAVLRRYAAIDHFWRWEMYQERGDNRFMTAHMFVEIADKLLHLWLALSRTYYNKFKWLDMVTERLTVAPLNAVTRLNQVFKVEPTEGIAVLTALIEETYDLMERDFPAIDVAFLRRIFRFRRPLWNELPPTL